MKLSVCTLVTMVVIAMLIDDSDAWFWQRKKCKPALCKCEKPKIAKYFIRSGCKVCWCERPPYWNYNDKKRGEELEEEERSLLDGLDQKLDARQLEGLEKEVKSLLDVLKVKLDARELEGLEEEDYSRRRR
ncbi:uncharacterized protein [Branchiostoma lanceolatum]|uniref:uncharacterized protein n=1 Tax=Branchiostoma lanceolatum TaxID=7740 RepID=UPI0034568FC9